MDRPRYEARVMSPIHNGGDWMITYGVFDTHTQTFVQFENCYAMREAIERAETLNQAYLRAL